MALKRSNLVKTKFTFLQIATSFQLNSKLALFLVYSFVQMFKKLSTSNLILINNSICVGSMCPHSMHIWSHMHGICETFAAILESSEWQSLLRDLLTKLEFYHPEASRMMNLFLTFIPFFTNLAL